MTGEQGPAPAEGLLSSGSSIVTEPALTWGGRGGEGRGGHDAVEVTSTAGAVGARSLPLGQVWPQSRGVCWRQSGRQDPSPP